MNVIENLKAAQANLREAENFLVQAACPIEFEMNNFTAVAIAEGFEEASEERQLEAWQYLHDTGLAYRLQGYFGRQCKALIEAGHINP